MCICIFNIGTIEIIFSELDSPLSNLKWRPAGWMSSRQNDVHLFQPRPYAKLMSARRNVLTALHVGVINYDLVISRRRGVLLLLPSRSSCKLQFGIFHAVPDNNSTFLDFSSDSCLRARTQKHTHTHTPLCRCVFYWYDGMQSVVASTKLYIR